MTGKRFRILRCVATLLACVQPVLGAANDVHLVALDQGLTLVCAEDGTSAPQFRHHSTGTLSPIRDPRLRAIAERVCHPLLEATPARVDLTNSRETAIFIGFSLATPAPGPITWGTGCTPTGGGAQIAPGATCQVTVATAAGSSRFCAALDQPPADCYEAQANHQTMVETTFQAASNPGCFNKGSCIWYDISVIPQDCTDALWRQDQCAHTGGASYNLPVTLACGGAATFSCQGPTDATYGPANYPSQCGNPEAMCVGNTATCVQAYFFPMFTAPENKFGPNVPCLGGQTLGVNFLPGP